MTELPRGAVDRVIRKTGARRVSESAAEELAEILEEKGIEIASEAAELAEHGIQMEVELKARKRNEWSGGLAL